MTTVAKNSKLIVPFIFAILFAILAAQLIIDFKIAYIAGFAIIGFAVTFFVYPKTAFLLLFFIRPLIDLFWDKPMLGLKNPLYLLGGLVILLIVIFILINKIKFLEIPYSNLVIFFLLTQLVSLFLPAIFSPELKYKSLIIFTKVINGFFFFLAMPFIFKTQRDIDRLTTVLLLSTVIPLLITYYVWLNGSPGIFGSYFTGGEEIGRGVYVQWRGLSRISGLYQGTFNVAFLCILVLFLGIFKLKNSNNPQRKKLLFAYMLIVLPLLFYTYSRTGWGMALIGVGTWLFLKNKRNYALLLMIGVILILVFSESAQLRFGDEIAFFTGTGDFMSMGSGRGSQWLSYINIYIYQFSLVDKLFGNIGKIGNPHNQLLYLLLANGIIGLLSCLFMIVSITFGLFRFFKKQTEGFQKDFLLFVFILHIAFIFAWIGGTPLLWINSQWVIWSLIGIALYQVRLIDQRYHLQESTIIHIRK